MILHPTYLHRSHNRLRILPVALYTEMKANPEKDNSLILGQGLTKDNSFKLKFLSFSGEYIVRCIADKDWIRIEYEATAGI